MANTRQGVFSVTLYGDGSSTTGTILMNPILTSQPGFWTQATSGIITPMTIASVLGIFVPTPAQPGISQPTFTGTVSTNTVSYTASAAFSGPLTINVILGF